MLEVVHTLTSEQKLRIFNMLDYPRAPESLANDLRITRQAVDKHLRDMLQYGLVRKRHITDSGRQKVMFETSDLGKYFYGRIQSLVDDFKMKGKQELGDNLKHLGLKLYRGDVKKDEYMAAREKEMEEHRWFQ